MFQGGRRLLAGLLMTLLSLPAFARQPAGEAALRAEIERLRQEIDALRAEYDERLRALQASLAALQAAPATAPAPAPAAPVPAGAAGAGGPTGSLPVYGNVNALSKIFNPDLAVIGNFLGAGGTNGVDPTPAMSLEEVETALQAVVDPYARADVFFAVSGEGLEVEEAYITFPTLPGGLVMKAGKVRSAFGKVNQQHTHVLPWADRPLVVRNMLGGDEGLAGAGVSVARLLPNPWIFLELTGEVSHQASDIFRGTRRRDVVYAGRVRGYQDLTESANLDLGASIAYGPNDVDPSSTTRLVGIDATFRYRPLRRAIYRRLQARTELVWGRRSELPGATSFGAYIAGDYQFARRWFAGVRYDYAERLLDPTAFDRGMSWLVTFWPSEFSQVRTQYRRIRYHEGETANELLMQLLFSIGAHGAHPF